MDFVYGGLAGVFWLMAWGLAGGCKRLLDNGVRS